MFKVELKKEISYEEITEWLEKLNQPPLIHEERIDGGRGGDYGGRAVAP